MISRLMLPVMTGWYPIAEQERSVLAESESGDWPWVFEVWRQSDREGVEQVFYTVRDRRGGSFSVKHVQLDSSRPVDRDFEQRTDGVESVLFGPVSDGIEAIVVEPTHPIRRPPVRAELVEAASGLGRFFFCSFDYEVEQANMTGEPSERWERAFPWATNLRLQMRRQVREGSVIGEGRTPNGGWWRLRVWRRAPDDVRVDLITATAIEEFDVQDRIGFIGGGHGGPPLEEDRLIKLPSMQRGSGEQQIIGEVACTVASVRVRLDDGEEVSGQVLRTDVVGNDYFVAFAKEEQEVTGVVALDAEGRVLAEQARSQDSIRHSREFRRRHSGRGNSD